MSYVPFYDEPRPLEVDKLRLVHARSDLNDVSLGADGHMVLHNRQSEQKPFENTIHFTLNAVVQTHTYGNFDACHCVIVAPLQETVAMGNAPEGLLAADTYFHTDANRNMQVANPVLFAPQGMKVPEELEPHVRRYPRGHTDQETVQFKLRAVGEHFKEQGLYFDNVGYDDWQDAPDHGRGRKIQEALDLPEATFWGRHMNSPSYEFGRTMKALFRDLEKFRSGERYLRDPYGRDIPIASVIEEDVVRLNEFLQRREEAGDPPKAMEFYRKHAADYNRARHALLPAGPQPAPFA